jgi:hypothetical protein
MGVSGSSGEVSRENSEVLRSEVILRLTLPKVNGGRLKGRVEKKKGCFVVATFYILCKTKKSCYSNSKL